MAASINTSISSLLESGKYSDLTITCGGDRYAVHKSIVCTQSRFFAAACDGPFTVEAQTGEIKLDDDDPLAVRMMITYLYRATYEPTETSTPATAPIEVASNGSFSVWDSAEEFMVESPMKKRRGMFKGEPISPRSARSQQQDLGVQHSGPNASSSSNSRQLPMSNLALHAKVYALGEKYGIKDMKDLALQKFKQDTKGAHTIESITAAAREAYTSTIDEDRGMRDAVIKIVLIAPCVLEIDIFRDVVRETELGLGLALHFTRNKRENKRKRN